MISALAGSRRDTPTRSALEPVLAPMLLYVFKVENILILEKAKHNYNMWRREYF
jgi:hypothetical protein